MVCFVVMCVLVFVWFSVCSNLISFLLLLWYLIFIVFCLMVGSEILVGNGMWIWDFILRWIRLVEVKIMVLYLFVFSLVRWVFMFLCRFLMIRLGWYLWIWYCLWRLDVFIIVFWGRVFKLLWLFEIKVLNGFFCL